MMADLVNPYANPYLPSFVNQRPRMNDMKPPTQMPQMPQLNMAQQSYTQIRSVNGYEGARAYVSGNLAPGASDILAESDPNIPRIYITAKDSAGQIIVEGYRLIHEEEPKPVTMEDLNSKISELLERMNRMEEKDHERNGKPGGESSWKDRSANQSPARNQQGGRGPQLSGSGAAADSN